jgi:uncharacterized protein (DUF1330 family)
MSDPIDPDPAAIHDFIQGGSDKPVVMLNLLRYHPDGGRELYQQYAMATAPHLARVGGQLLYAGDCDLKLVAPDGHRWDTVAVVRYPTRQAFLDMIADPEYIEISKIRSQALSAAVLEATVPLSL